MEEGAPGLLTGTVEADETYVGGRYDRRRKRAPHEKQPVVGFLERSADGQPSRVRAFPNSHEFHNSSDWCRDEQRLNEC